MSQIETPVAAAAPSRGRIRVGVGGWTFAPWRDNFYPKGLPHKQELAWASRRLSTIEVNGTFYSSFKPASFARWRDETPEDFVFSLKAHRFTTHRKRLATAAEPVMRFLQSGLSELGPKLGPIIWQFMPTHVFDPSDFEAFLSLLPHSMDGLRLRHVLDVRHSSFQAPEYLRLARRHGCVAVHTDAEKFPDIRDVDGEFAYLRLMRSESDVATGYPAAALDQWADGARSWAGGARPRDVYIYFINGAKERAPAAALAMLQRLA